MNINIHHRNLELLSTHQKLIDRHCQKIKKLIPTFSADSVDLTVNLEKLARGSQFRSSVTLSLPQRVIRVEEIEDNPTSSIVRSFAELHRRIGRFKSQLKRETLRNRVPKPPIDQSIAEAWEVENVAGESLDKVENYIRREIYHQVLTGSMPPGILEPHALVDEVYLHVTSNSSKKPPNLSLEQWMIQTARQTVRQRLNDLEATRNYPHFEEPAKAPGTWDDEELNFFQPDESLQLEDLLQDSGSSNPELLLQRQEVAGSLQKAIANLPLNVRESFVLFALEGFTSDEVAMMSGKRPEDVIAEVDDARRQLQKKLQI